MNDTTTWNAEQPIVSIKDVHKAYGDFEVLKGISLDLMKGDVICIIGPSGSGKSTLIRCINALADIQGGSIRVEGQEVHHPKLDKLALRRKVGMVFQQYNLFPHKTALQNVMMAPLKVLGQPKQEVELRARALLKKVYGWKERKMPIQASCPVANSSASRSPGRWRCNLTSCCSTRSRRRWTRSR
ncbi:ABC-type polar amino acid transport system ATPase subunit [Rhizobium leguminosarum]|nr:ABC-type polar amino acid transport system ATPase subunit [Rhizobium leguminosarum]